MLPLIMVFSSLSAFAAPIRTAPVPKKSTPPATAPLTTTPSTANTAAPVAAPTKSPWGLLYNGEYYGPRFSNFDLTKAQGPLDAQPDYTNWNHTVKVSYAITDEFIVGGALRFRTLFNPAVSSFASRDHRLFFTWAKMIDTEHVSMGTTVDFEFPTSDGSRAADNQQVLAINLKNSWGFKIPSSNFSFGALTLIRNTYSNLPSKGESIYLGLFPEIEYSVSPQFSLLASGSFDASNSYRDVFWELSQVDPDYIAAGFKYSPNSHLEFHPAAQFYTADFNVPALYFEVSVIF